MSTDQTSGAGAYKPDRSADRTEGRDARPPFHLNIAKDRELKLDYRQTAIAAGALGLGYLAWRGVSALLDRRADKAAIAAGHSGRLEPVPLAASATADVKDNAAPRFPGEGIGAAPGAPFVAASTEDDTGDLVVEVTEIDVVAIAPLGADRSADTAEHVPTDLMADHDVNSGDRAIDAFRPDPTAPVPDGMRESLRPATGPAKAFAADRGDFASGLSQADGSK